MKYYLIAGEASGDLHGANLMKELKIADPQAEFRFFGGDLMQAQTGKLVKHFKEMAFMGFVDVLMNIGSISQNLKMCKHDIFIYQPDAVILIDYSGFNLRIAKFVHGLEIKTLYYISPKIWAWNQSRAAQIKAYVDKMFVIFPFEIEFYKKLNYQVDFVGNPLLDALKPYQNKKDTFEQFTLEHKLSKKPILALLAGSRRQEIKRALPIMLETAKKFENDFQIVIAGAPSIEKEFYEIYCKNYSATLLSGKTYEILQHTHTALVTSGTATLETALFNVPEVVCYRIQGGKLVWDLFRQIIKVKYVSLVNLIMDQAVIVELLQHKFNVDDLTKETQKLLYDQPYRAQMLQNFKILRQLMGGAGASKRSAEIMVNYLNQKSI